VSEDFDKNTYLFHRIGGQIAYRNRESGFKVPLSDGLVERRRMLCVERDFVVYHQ